MLAGNGTYVWRWSVVEEVCGAKSARERARRTGVTAGDTVGESLVGLLGGAELWLL